MSIIMYDSLIILEIVLVCKIVWFLVLKIIGKQ